MDVPAAAGGERRAKVTPFDLKHSQTTSELTDTAHCSVIPAQFVIHPT
jgi:hypothetical protein